MTIYHRHHVVPRHAGGTDDPSNIIVCTIEEHAEHHRYRYEMTGDEYDRIAWQSLLGMISKQETIHQVQIETGRRNGRAQLGRRKQSEETRRKIGKANRGKLRGRKLSEETRRKLRDKKHSEEARRKISEAKRGEKHPLYGMMWITNEHVSMRIKKTDPIPNGFRKGRVLSVLVPPAGFEPAAHSLEGCCSVQLS